MKIPPSEWVRDTSLNKNVSKRHCRCVTNIVGTLVDYKYTKLHFNINWNAVKVVLNSKKAV